MKLTKTFLILLFSFCFLGVANAERLTWSSFFFPKLEKYEECNDKLRDQNVDNYYKLCADKYAKVLDDSYIKSSKYEAHKSGAFSFDVENTSSKYIIEKINIKGYFKCKDETKCERLYFNVTTYPTIAPGETQEVNIYTESTDINIPEEVKQGEWSWYISSKKFLGFKIEY